jgi:transposase InsO family protein
LHAEGWTVSAIAGYLAVHRSTVHAILRRWRDEDFAGLPDKPHTRNRRALKTDLRALDAARKLQENPLLGEFRLHAKLKQLGIELSPRTCGRILAVNRELYGLGRPPRTKSMLASKPMPFAATRRHEYWSVDVRYLDHRLGGGNVYCIAVLDNYSRAILASGVFRSQDTLTFLLMLRAAVVTYGSPEALVSDSGAIFRSHQAQAVYAALGIRKEAIDRGEPWQDYIETTFNIQRRMADWHFAQAQTWAELVTVHDRWLADYNAQQHWAHRSRRDGRRSPQEVLGWVTGTLQEPATVERTL